jgi:hypothetical protein
MLINKKLKIEPIEIFKDQIENLLVINFYKGGRVVLGSIYGPNNMDNNNDMIKLLANS